MRPAIRLGSAVIVHNHKGQILLGRKKNRRVWIIPGGKVEYGETLQEAGIREIFEETGLTITIQRRLGTYELIDKTQHRVIVYHTGRVAHGSWFLRAGDDLCEAKWVDLRDLHTINLSPFVRMVLIAEDRL